GLPAYVEREFYDYLQCGILAHGFLRLGCDTCKKELLVPFSCKRRGFCPSCAGRRMAQMAAHLVRHRPVSDHAVSFSACRLPAHGEWLGRPGRPGAPRYDNAHCLIVCTSLRSSLRVCQSVYNRHRMRLHQALTPGVLLLSVAAPPRGQRVATVP